MTALNGEKKELYLILAVIGITGGSFAFNNANDNVTIDKIEAIDDKIAVVNKALDLVRISSTEHEKLFAHAGINSKTDSIKNQVDSLDERLTYLERTMSAWLKTYKP